MEGIIDRLKALMLEKNLNNNQLTQLAGLSIGLIGKALASKKGLHSDSIEKILHALPDVNAQWLMTGEGSMFRHEATTKSVLASAVPESEIIQFMRELMREKEALLKEKEATIRTQSEEIGALKKERDMSQDNAASSKKAGTSPAPSIAKP